METTIMGFITTYDEHLYFPPDAPPPHQAHPRPQEVDQLHLRRLPVSSNAVVLDTLQTTCQDFRLGHPNGGFLKLGYHFGGPHNKDYSILKSILGCPNFGKLPNAQSWPASLKIA